MTLGPAKALRISAGRSSLPAEGEVNTDGIEQGNGPINFWKKNESPEGERGNPALMRRAHAGLSVSEDMP